MKLCNRFQGLAFFSLLIFSSGGIRGLSAVSAEDADAHARFISQYPTAAQTLRNRLNNVELQMEIQYDHSVNGPAVRTFFFRDGLGGDLVVPRTERPRANIYNRAHLCTDDGQICILYQYQPKGDYTIAQSEKVTEEGRARFLASYIDEVLFACVSFGPPITSYLCDPANIKQVEAIPGLEQEELIQVDFSVPDGEATRLKEGRLVFDVAQDWVLKRFERCKFESPEGVVSYSNGNRTFRQLPNGGWVPQVLSYSSEYEYEGQHHETTYIENAAFVSANLDVPESRFKLSGYNLATIDQGGEPKRNTFRLLIFLNAFVLLGGLLTWCCFRLLKPLPKPDSGSSDS